MNGVNATFNSQPFSPPFDQNASNSPFGQSLGAGGINPNSLDLLQYQSPTSLQALGDGNALSNSPNPSQTPFQVPPVVPAKRGRPGEDNVSASPRPNAPAVPGSSRSHTPQQFNQYAGQPGAQQFQTPTPFQQMQHVGSAHGSPSPGPQNQMNSPRAFSGQVNPMAQFNQMQNPMNRMGTPQNAAQHSMMRGLNPGAPQTQAMDASMGGMFPNAQGASPANMNPQMQAMRRQYEAQLARNQQQLQNAQQGDQQNPILAQQRAAWAAGANGQQPQRPGMPQAPTQGMTDADKGQEAPFLKSFKTFQEQRNKQVNPNPTVCGRPISYYKLFTSYAKINPQQNPQQGWPTLAASMGFPPAQMPTAIQELRHVFDQDLKDFYSMYFKAMRERRMRAGQQQPGQMPSQGSPTVRNKEGLPQTPSSGGVQFQQAQHGVPQAPSPGLQRGLNATNAQGRPNMPQQTSMEAAPGLNGHRKSGSLFSNISTPDAAQVESMQAQVKPSPVQPSAPPSLSKPSGDNHFDPQYQPRRRALTSYGGLDIEAFADTGSKLRDLKLYPRFEELGAVDLHVINMCLLSGFHAETKYALDRLCALSQGPLRLWDCEDLFDSLIGCGEAQVRQLGESGSGTPGTEDLPNFHELVKSGTEELESLQDGTGFGDCEYEAAHATDRLLAVTTILRNLSFPLPETQMTDRDVDANTKILTGPIVKDFLVGAIKTLSIHRKALKTARNMQDLMKDLITVLSNIADNLELSSEDEARLFLEFILAFTPARPAGKKTSGLEFTMYNPSKHQYLPCAVDCLAKLLARDDPNRTHYRSIFHADGHENHDSPAQLLITQAFALALAPIPDTIGGTFSTSAANHLALQRRPFLSQGMLAADILSTLVPSWTTIQFETKETTSLEKALLRSKDGWAPRLMRVIMAMAVSDAGMAPVAPGRDRATGQVIDNGRPFTTITQRALSMIRRLVERADRAEMEQSGNKGESVSLGLFGAAPLEGVLFSAMSLPTFDNETMKSLSALASMAK